MNALSVCRRVAFFASLSVGACSFDSAIDPYAACIEGESIACECAGASTAASAGAQFCGADGEFGACECSELGSGGSGGAPPVGGSAAIGGAWVPVGGTASIPSVDAGGSAGMSAGAGTGGSDGGESGSSGGEGGADGPAGMGGMAGEGTGGSPVVDVPAPGEAPYGECRADGTCDLPMLCVFDLLSGGTERYCAAICNATGLGGPDCPPRADGSVALCVSNLCMR